MSALHPINPPPSGRTSPRQPARVGEGTPRREPRRQRVGALEVGVHSSVRHRAGVECACVGGGRTGIGSGGGGGGSGGSSSSRLDGREALLGGLVAGAAEDVAAGPAPAKDGVKQGAGRAARAATAAVMVRMGAGISGTEIQVASKREEELERERERESDRGRKQERIKKGEERERE